MGDPTTLRAVSSLWVERALTVALVGVAAGEELVRGAGQSALVVAAVLVVGATLLVRRTHPVAGTITAAAIIAALPNSGSPAVVAFLLPLILAYSCGAHAPMWPGLAATVALTLALQLHVGLTDAPNVEIAVTTLPCWWGGMQVRRRRALVRELTARTRELEAEEEAFVRLSVRRERARIARDLHDIVSHHLAVMVIQAGAGRLTQPWRTDIAADRFEAIRDAGREALAEADRLVVLLHADATAAPRLASLLERAGRDGARVRVAPASLVLEPETEAIAYRIVQEALTNAMKHAPGAAVDIDVTAGRAELTIEVRNAAVDAASDIAGTGAGLGLHGMRERVAAHGGALVAGPDAGGGFRLWARLPVDGVRAAFDDRITPPASPGGVDRVLEWPALDEPARHRGVQRAVQLGDVSADP